MANTSIKSLEAYHRDYENEPIGGSNPYYRCVHCKVADPSINGRIEGHLSTCEYRLAKESGLKYPAGQDDESDAHGF